MRQSDCSTQFISRNNEQGRRGTRVPPILGYTDMKYYIVHNTGKQQGRPGTQCRKKNRSSVVWYHLGSTRVKYCSGCHCTRWSMRGGKGMVTSSQSASHPSLQEAKHQPHAGVRNPYILCCGSLLNSGCSAGCITCHEPFKGQLLTWYLGTRVPVLSSTLTE